VVVLAIRGYYQDSMGKSGTNDRGIYDDAAFVVLSDRVVSFNFNTDPSAWRSAIATLNPGIWTYWPGKHKVSDPDGYPAFRQADNVAVTRDGKGTEIGQFGINIHRGGVNGTSSLGCQTVPPAQWDEFKSLVYGANGVTDADVAKYPSGVVKGAFQYILVTKTEAEKILGRKI
jgi:lysozyme